MTCDQRPIVQMLVIIGDFGDRDGSRDNAQSCYDREPSTEPIVMEGRHCHPKYRIGCNSAMQRTGPPKRACSLQPGLAGRKSSLGLKVLLANNCSTASLEIVANSHTPVRMVIELSGFLKWQYEPSSIL